MTTTYPLKSIFQAAFAANSIDLMQASASSCTSKLRYRAYLVALATRKRVRLSELTNDLLEKEIAILEVAK